MNCNVSTGTSYIPLEIADIARDHCIGFEEARLLKIAFEIAFGEPLRRERIYADMDELDRQAREKGEPDGLRIGFAVDMDADGYTLMRHARELGPGETALAPGKVEVFCRISGSFPTAKWLGPLVLKRDKTSVASTVDHIAAAPVISPDVDHEVEYTAEYCVQNGLPIVLSEEEALEWLGDIPEEWPMYRDDTRRFAAPPVYGHGHVAGGRTTLSALSRFSASSGAGSFGSRSACLFSDSSPPTPFGDYGHSGRNLSSAINPRPSGQRPSTSIFENLRATSSAGAAMIYELPRALTSGQRFTMISVFDRSWAKAPRLMSDRYPPAKAGGN